MSAQLIRQLPIDPMKGTWYYFLDGDPASVGFATAVDSLALRVDTSGLGRVYKKTGAPDTGWTEITGGSSSAPIATTLVTGTVRVDNDSAGDPQALTAAGHLLAADPHPQYALDTEKGAASGIATLDGASKLTASQLPLGSSSTTAAAGNDARLSNARTPTAHASTHVAAGSDPLTLAESQITNLVSDLAGKAATTHTHVESDVTGLVADLANKVSKTTSNAVSSGSFSLDGVVRVRNAVATNYRSDFNRVGQGLFINAVDDNLGANQPIYFNNGLTFVSDLDALTAHNLSLDGAVQTAANFLGPTPWYDVKANNGATAGALGDGSTDDTTAVQNCINRCLAAGGGTVFFPVGTYVVANLQFNACVNTTTYIRLLGGGWSSILKLKAASATNVVFLNSPVTNPLAGAIVQDLQIDGNRANAASAIAGIRTDVNDTTILNCFIQNTNQDGVFSSPGTGAHASRMTVLACHFKNLGNASYGGFAVAAANTDSFTMMGCVADSCGAGLVDLETTSAGDITEGVSVVGNTCTNTQAWLPAAGVIQIFADNGGTNSARKGNITGNQISVCGGSGINVSSSYGVTVTGNTVVSAARHGISILGPSNGNGTQYFSCTGNIIKDCSTSSANTYDGIYCNFARDGVVNGNSVTDSGAKHRYHINLNTCQRVIATQNPILATSAQTAPIGFSANTDCRVDNVAGFDVGNPAFGDSQYQLQFQRATISGSNRMTLTGTAKMLVTDLGFASDTIIGTPKEIVSTMRLPDNYNFQQYNRIALTGTGRLKLDGKSNYILTDDLFSRSRLNLAGRG